MSHVTAADMDALVLQAKSNSRRRQHLNLHASPEEPSQRLLNAVCLDSYIRPHRHIHAETDECLLAIRGRFALVQFDDTGGVVAVHRFGAGEATGIVQVSPAVWHTVLALTEDAVLFEAKSGPYIADQAKTFASWAPEEGASEQLVYLQKLRDIVSAS